MNNNLTSLDACLYGASYNVYFHGGGGGTTTPIPSLQWVQLVFTYTSGTIAVYFNGVSQPLTGVTTGYNITNTSALWIGQYIGGGNYFLNGNIPIMNVYNRALSAEEVKQNFNALRGRFGI